MTRGTLHRLTGSIDVPLTAAFAAMPVVLLAAQLPPGALLPAIAVLAFAMAVLAATIAYMARTPRDAGAVTIRDFAGACVLIGIAACAFSETSQVSQLFGIAAAAP